MTNNIIYIGLEVDDANFHGCALEPSTGEALAFKCRPTVKGLIRQINKIQKAFPHHEVTLCYEATHIGNTLKRDLHAHNIPCDVVANQKGYRSLTTTNTLNARRKDTEPELIRIAYRCHRRLHQIVA